ncbi:tyrosine-type recombinase/integrase [Bacillus weihaiensis]|uniref:tyrosine-type recombinase/integrase n=1 Tax=Bacillus weihaiensis TaxID=1547283 RepID=UPI002353C8E5|nr:tyrosine-type recombinase/integrase [Bacillus weihaiensis]
MEEFIVYLREEGNRESTIVTYVGIINGFKKWYEESFGQILDPQRVSALDVQNYKQYLLKVAKNKQQGRLSPKTVNKKIEGLRTYFRFLKHTGVIEVSPVDKVKPQKIQKRSDSVRWLDRNEKNYLVRVMNTPGEWRNKENLMIRNRAIVYFMLHAGLRIGEVVNLEMDDLDLVKQIIYIQDGKGGKFRRVEMNKDLLTALKQWLDIRPLDKGQQVFISQKGPMTAQGIQSMFREIRIKTNIEDLTPHALRHTFCHDLAVKGVSLSLIADLAGHSDLNTTRIYIRSNEEERRKALSMLSAEE